MNPSQLPVALLAFVALVALTPAWLHFSSTMTSSMPPATAWVARFTLPSVALLFVGGWMGGDVR